MYVPLVIDRKLCELATNLSYPAISSLYIQIIQYKIFTYIYSFIYISYIVKIFIAMGDS